MHELITKISDDLGISSEKAEAAARIILNFLHADGPPDAVQKLSEQLGLESSLASAPALKSGFLGRAIQRAGGGAMVAFSALSAEGLNMDEIQRIVQILIQFAEEKTSPELIDEITGAIPGLRQFL